MILYAKKEIHWETLLQIHDFFFETHRNIGHIGRAHLSNFKLKNSLDRNQTMVTISIVIAPPKITDGTVPNNFAATPDSKAPNSLEELTKIPFTEDTLPRISSGVKK